jgi:small GTP-binding protein
MAPMYYRGAKAAILVFDVTNEESFRRSMSWLRDLKAHADPDVVVCIAGNKFDKGPTFDLKTVEEYSNSVDASFLRTSAMSGENVDALFDILTTKIIDNLKEKINLAGQGESKIDISSRKNSRDKESVCC